MQYASANNALPSTGISTTDAISIGVTGFNTFLSGLSSQATSEATAADAKASAKIAGLNREKSNRNYERQISELKLNKKINLDTNYATYMYGGLTMMGTPERVQKTTAGVYDRDIALTRANQKTDDQIYATQYQSFINQEESAKRAGLFGKITSAIGGAMTGFAVGGPAGAFVGGGVGLFA